jgi:hypothetical protein
MNRCPVRAVARHPTHAVDAEMDWLHKTIFSARPRRGIVTVERFDARDRYSARI